MTELATLVSTGWTAFSFGATLAGLGGIGLILLALVVLPASLRWPVVVVGVILLAGAALFQAGQAKGTAVAAAAEAARTLQREKDRAAAAIVEERRQATAARAIARADAARAVSAEATARVAEIRLRDLRAYLAGTKDRPCATSEDARRLRSL